MGDHYLNAVALTIDAHPAVVIGRVWKPDEDLDTRLRDNPERRSAFNTRSFDERTFAWLLPAGALPTEAADAGEELTLGQFPAALMASVGRDAAARKLQELGLELRSDRIGRPASLSRRRNNLAENAITNLPDGVGMYSGLSVQGLALQSLTEPGDVALIIDQHVEHIIDVSLAELARADVDLLGVRLRWQHASGCTCSQALTGDVGRFLGGDPAGVVQVRDSGGEAQSLPAVCLAVHANRFMMAKYIASQTRQGQRTVAEALKKAADEFGDTPKRWKNLGATVPWLGKLILFDGVTATLGAPLGVPVATSTANQTAPVLLPSIPDGNLNFRYGAQELHANAALGLKRHGPYDEDQNRSDTLRAVIVAPKAFAGSARKLEQILMRGLGRFEGVKERYHLHAFEVSVEVFDQPTPDGYVNAVLAASRTSPDAVFYITKRDFRYSPRGQNPYLAAKAALLSANVPNQAVTIDVLSRPEGELQWSADSVGLALYAKAGNIPFVLHDPSGVRELVLGVGRADVFDPEQGGRRQRFGASVAIRQDGDFLFSGSTTPVNTDEDYEAHLTRLLEGSIDRYTTEQGASPERLVIYVFKRTGRRELSAMTNAIGDRDIEFALLHVNRDSPLWLVERAGNNIKPPPRGTMVALSDPDRLLITGDPRKPGGAHPLRLTLDRNSTYTDMDRLVRQAYGFTKTSYRGFQQTREPSLILFGRLLAEKVSQLVPYGFSPASAAGPLGDTPWFL